MIGLAAFALVPASASAQTVSPVNERGQSSLNVALPDGITRANLGERDPQTIAIQVMLDRSRHSPGVIDGYGGGNTERAIRAYRRTHGLADSGVVDRELLASLLRTQGGDIFRTYTITKEDLDYNFVDVPSGFAAKAELEQLNYETPLEMFAERFHMDREFLRTLNPGKDFSRAGTVLNIVSHGDETLQGEVARLEVRKAEGAVVALDSSGRILASYPATIGSDQFPSPNGSMTVRAVAPQPNYTFTPEGRA